MNIQLSNKPYQIATPVTGAIRIRNEKKQAAVAEDKKNYWLISEPVAVLVGHVTGVIGGVATTFAGNMHYTVFAKLIPALQSMLGIEVSSYWFPDATRYIGYNPDTNDKTIHEFPSYSFVLGDLHAHVTNIMFVLTVLGILYAKYGESLNVLADFEEKRLEADVQIKGRIRLGTMAWYVILFVLKKETRAFIKQCMQLIKKLKA